MGKGIQNIALKGEGIAKDIWEKFFQIISEGEIIWDVQTSIGDGVTKKLAPNADYVRHSVTIKADSGNTHAVSIGFNGTYSYSFSPGDSLTIEWFNPVKNNLCWNDLFNAGQTIYVVG